MIARVSTTRRSGRGFAASLHEVRANVSRKAGNIAKARKISNLIDYTEENGSLTFTVRVVPRASKSEIIGEHDGAVKVRLSSPPVDGAANAELVRVLAKYFGVAKSAVEIIAGHTSKTKTDTNNRRNGCTYSPPAEIIRR